MSDLNACSLVYVYCCYTLYWPLGLNIICTLLSGTMVYILCFVHFYLVLWFKYYMYLVPVDMESEQQLIGGQVLTSDSAIDFLTTTLHQTSDTRFRVLRDLLVFLTSTISLGDRVITIHTIHLLMRLKKPQPLFTNIPQMSSVNYQIRKKYQSCTDNDYIILEYR